jgi:hypothetical protein
MEFRSKYIEQAVAGAQKVDPLAWGLEAELITFNQKRIASLRNITQVLELGWICGNIYISPNIFRL